MVAESICRVGRRLDKVKIRLNSAKSSQIGALAELGNTKS